MEVKSIAECSKGSILQYFRPATICHKDLYFVYLWVAVLHKVLLYVAFSKSIEVSGVCVALRYDGVILICLSYSFTRKGAVGTPNNCSFEKPKMLHLTG